MQTLSAILAKELNTSPVLINKTIALLDDGATVPFISRYRKDETGGLDDVQLRKLHDRLIYLRELEQRKQVVLKNIEQQNKLTTLLEEKIHSTDSKSVLEEIYRPYMPKRRNKALIAMEAGLGGLAEKLLHNLDSDLISSAKEYINQDKKITTTDEALEGAKQILLEWFSSDADLNTELKDFLWNNAVLHSSVIEENKQNAIKFSDYFDTVENLKSIPSHRGLAMFRGRNEECLQLQIKIKEKQINSEDTYAPINQSKNCIGKILNQFKISSNSKTGKWLCDIASACWRVKLATRIDTELKLKLREKCDGEAIEVFAKNLSDVLMAAPAGPKNTIGLDPGFRSGVKVAVVNSTGMFLDNTVIYPHAPQNQYAQAIATLHQLIIKYDINLISIGNGTASRETDQLVNDLFQQYPNLNIHKITVSEAGASVYSASELATEEFPDLDVTVRGAISIARRIQDPLAELVKIDPKSIGVGQYQHDVNQIKLSKKLDEVIEDCVNSIGVDINTASMPLLTRVSGLNKTLAKNVIEFRDKNGRFKNRDQLKKVPRLGEKSFEQCAGFLRILGGNNPLDASAVHPESYQIVNSILQTKKVDITKLIGNKEILNSIHYTDFATQLEIGKQALNDILQELEKPNRDPRPEFKTANFKTGINDIKNLEENMILEGVVTNVTNFGAFVDIGVHQDGLIHISALSNKFISDPHALIKTGDVIKVKVLNVDIERKRISLSKRLDDKSNSEPGNKPIKPANKKQSSQKSNTLTNAFSQAFANATRKQ